MIKRLESENKKNNHRYDNTAGKWVAYSVDIRAGNKRYRATFPTKAEAEKFTTELRGKFSYSKIGLQPQASRKVRISQLFEKRLAQIKTRKEHVNTQTAFNRFREVVGYDAFVVDIRKSHFQQFINKRMETVSGETVRRDITRISTPFFEAERMFPVELEGFEPPTIVRPKAKRKHLNKRVISEAEKSAIVLSVLNDRLQREKQQRTVSRPTIAAMFEIAWMLGLRYAEVINLKKNNFHADERSLILIRHKTKTLTQLEFLPARAIEILSTSAEASPTEFIFDLVCSNHTMAQVLKEACEANGITYGQGKLDGITFHSTRHAFTTRIVQVTDISTAAAFTGHSDKEMVAYYSHASQASKKAAMDAMYGTDDRSAAMELFEKTRAGEIDFDAFYEIYLGRK